MTWYEDMASAMQKRQLAINGRERWQARVDEAEAEIAQLTREQQQVSSMGIKPEAAASFSGLAPDYSETAE